jgi:CRP-like cAMP-binding protein
MPDSRFDPLFRKLERRDVISDEERSALMACAGDQKIVPAGADLVSEGDRPDVSTLVLSGFSTRYRLLSDGQRQITSIHVPGDFVDLHSLLLKHMDHSVGALSTCTILAFPHARLRQLTRDYPHLTRVLWLMTLLDSAIHREWLVSMGRRSAAQQMAHLICEICVRLDVIGQAPDRSFHWPMTQIELGDTLGLSVVHVNRTLQDLRAERLFTWQQQTITILDWERLQERAEFDARYLHLETEPR